MSEEKGLTTRQKLFISAYIVDKNATKAAIAAGYSEKSATCQGSRMLKNVKVQAAIDELLNKATAASLVTVEYILEGLREVAERCMQRKPVMVFDKVDKCMVQATEQFKDEKGEIHLEHIWEFDSQGANRALELLGKYKKMFTDRVEVEEINQLAEKIKEARQRALAGK